jgi:hypothetical protein
MKLLKYLIDNVHKSDCKLFGWGLREFIQLILCWFTIILLSAAFHSWLCSPPPIVSLPKYTIIKAKSFIFLLVWHKLMCTECHVSHSQFVTRFIQNATLVTVNFVTGFIQNAKLVTANLLLGSVYCFSNIGCLWKLHNTSNYVILKLRDLCTT